MMRILRMTVMTVKQLSLMVLTLCALALCAAPLRAQDAGRNSSLQIKSMQVKLFMMREGTFGDDLIATDQARIVWNVGVNYTADTFLVIVEVAGTPIMREPFPRLVLTATRGRRVVLHQTAKIFNAIGDGTYHAAFLVPTTGCDPVKLTARIPGQRRAATMTQLINFQCGE